MANREALRDLQTRLASRLQAARTQAVSASWLAVLIGKKHCLFPLTQAGEIFPISSVAKVPYAYPWFSGVVNLRGGLYGVVDLVTFMGEPIAGGRTEQAWADCRLVTFNAELDINCALIIDGLIGLRREDAFAGMHAVPAGSPPYLGNQLVDKEGRSWQEIDLRALSQMASFLSIAA